MDDIMLKCTCSFSATLALPLGDLFSRPINWVSVSPHMIITSTTVLPRHVLGPPSFQRETLKILGLGLRMCLQIIVVQAADLIQARKIIPWLGNVGAMLLPLCSNTGHQIYGKNSWPHDLSNNHWLRNIGGLAGLCMTKNLGRKQLVILLNLGQKLMYAQCFMGQAVSTENWCSKCQCLNLTIPPLTALNTKGRDNGTQPWEQGPISLTEELGWILQYALSINRDCKFDREYRFLHIMQGSSPHQLLSKEYKWKCLRTRAGSLLIDHYWAVRNWLLND